VEGGRETWTAAGKREVSMLQGGSVRHVGGLATASWHASHLAFLSKSTVAWVAKRRQMTMKAPRGAVGALSNLSATT
jgi:hypothetical protein